METNNFIWKEFAKKIKDRYLSIAPHLWWGDDLDVRFYFLKELSSIKEKKILDLGCNVGISLSFLDKSNKIYGIDIDEYCVAKATQLNPSANIVQCSMDSLPFEDSSFDVVSMMNVLPYFDFFVEEKEKDKFIKNTMDEVYRVLKSNGELIFSTPNGESVHYNKSKVALNELKTILNRFEYEIYGWNNIKPISKRLPKKIMFTPPKVLCKFEFIWIRLVNNMNKDIKDSKYFFINAKKRN